MKNSKIMRLKKCLTFVNSKLLFQKYKDNSLKLVEVKTTTLTEKDFFIERILVKNQQFNFFTQED